TKSFKVFRVDNGILLEIGEPTSVTWWAEGRPATRAEVENSITTGLPFLAEIAQKQGPDALVALNAQLERAKPLLPAAA
ncbi:hypothetical protein, partial [Lacticaseibacillus rhamnosus]|uniref:hypothetical protein n=1 Tax=Lacticaseibacillus rhamnosus TaxID=47715 RepID=UPI00194F34C5